MATKVGETPKETSVSAVKELMTLAVDTGGTGIKMMVLDSQGKPQTERVRFADSDACYDGRQYSPSCEDQGADARL